MIGNAQNIRQGIFVQVYASLRRNFSLVRLVHIVHDMGRTFAPVRRADHPAPVKVLGKLGIQLNVKVTAADDSRL
jgi:hypothetical protein